MEYLSKAQTLDNYLKLIFRAQKPKKMLESIQGGVFIMRFLSESTTNVSPGDISNEMNISTARIAKALNSLEDKGLIKREINQEDRRQIIVALTDDGRELSQEIKDRHMKHITNLLTYLGQKDSDELIRIVKRISEFNKSE